MTIKIEKIHMFSYIKMLDILQNSDYQCSSKVILVTTLLKNINVLCILSKIFFEKMLINYNFLQDQFCQQNIYSMVIERGNVKQI